MDIFDTQCLCFYPFSNPLTADYNNLFNKRLCGFAFNPFKVEFRVNEGFRPNNKWLIQNNNAIKKMTTEITTSVDYHCTLCAGKSLSSRANDQSDKTKIHEIDCNLLYRKKYSNNTKGLNYQKCHPSRLSLDPLRGNSYSKSFGWLKKWKSKKTTAVRWRENFRRTKRDYSR